jgi:hypothetical protein
MNVACGFHHHASRPSIVIAKQNRRFHFQDRRKEGAAKREVSKPRNIGDSQSKVHGSDCIHQLTAKRENAYPIGEGGGGEEETDHQPHFMANARRCGAELLAHAQTDRGAVVKFGW